MRRPTWIGLLVFVFALTFGAGSAFAAAKSKLEKTVEPLIGISYRYGGTTTKGFDCSGFVRYVFKQFDIELPRSSSDMIKLGQKVTKNELRPGDLVFFNTSGKGVSHVGIYMGDNKFVHSSTSKGVVYTDLDSEYYAKRYVGARRILDAQTYQKIAADPATVKKAETPAADEAAEPAAATDAQEKTGTDTNDATQTDAEQDVEQGAEQDAVQEG